MAGIHKSGDKRIAPAYTKYDGLSVDTALARAWDDMDLSPLDRSTLRVRVRAQHPALARTLDRMLAMRRGLPDPAAISQPNAVVTVDFPEPDEPE